MKEKIKKIFKYWRVFLEIGVVVWAINGMYRSLFNKSALALLIKNPLCKILIGKGINIYLVIILFYFLSAVLILYLLRKHEN